MSIRTVKFTPVDNLVVLCAVFACVIVIVLFLFELINNKTAS